MNDKATSYIATSTELLPNITINGVTTMIRINQDKHTDDTIEAMLNEGIATGYSRVIHYEGIVDEQDNQLTFENDIFSLPLSFLVQDFTAIPCFVAKVTGDDGVDRIFLLSETQAPIYSKSKLKFIEGDKENWHKSFHDSFIVDDGLTLSNSWNLGDDSNDFIDGTIYHQLSFAIDNFGDNGMLIIGNNYPSLDDSIYLHNLKILSLVTCKNKKEDEYLITRMGGLVSIFTDMNQ